MLLPISALTLLALPTVLGYNYTIGVGKDQVTGLVGVGFDPTRTIVSADATIVFQMFPGNHSVVQTTFDSPCVPGLVGAFNTGIINVANTTANNDRGPQFPFFGNDTANSIYWFYDGAGNNCYQGAVFCVNCAQTGNQTIDAFKAAALALGTAQGVASSIRSNAPFSTTTPPAPTSTSMTANITSMTNGNGTGTASGSIASNTSKPTGAAGKLLVGGSVGGLVAVLGVVGLLL